MQSLVTGAHPAHCNILSYRPTVSACLYTHSIDLYKFFFKVHTFDQRCREEGGRESERPEVHLRKERRRGEVVSSAATDLDQKYLLQNQSQRHQYFITGDPAGRHTAQQSFPFSANHFVDYGASNRTILFSSIVVCGD